MDLQDYMRCAEYEHDDLLEYLLGDSKVDRLPADYPFLEPESSEEIPVQTSSAIEVEKIDELGSAEYRAFLLEHRLDEMLVEYHGNDSTSNSEMDRHNVITDRVAYSDDDSGTP